MRQIRYVVLALLAVLILSRVLPASDRRDWANVERLKPGTAVAIEDWNGSYLHGQIESANDAGLVLVGQYPNPHPGLARTIGRDLIWKVRLTPKAPALPNIQKCAVVGAVVGGVAGAAGGAADAKDGKGAAAVFGAGIGALGGFAGGALVCGVAAVVTTVSTIIVRPPRLIYEDSGPRPIPAISP